jgi:hypothetical protein
MPEAKDLAPNFRHVRLLLAREKEHPHGDPGEGYDLLVPLGDDGRLDAETKRALEAFGAMFIAEADGMGAGVRLKFTRQDVRQIGRLEGEGGVARSDDVP